MTYKAWILCRISSKDQSQGDSLECQEQKAKELLEELGFFNNEIKIFKEVFSGRKDVRPVFNQVINFSKKHSKTLQYGCIFDIDRFSRAGAGFYDKTKRELKELGIQLIDANRVIQPERNMLKGSGGVLGGDFEYEWSVFSSSESTELQKAQQAKEELRKILLRTISKQIHYVQNGYQVRQASYGFRNIKKIDPETGKKRTYLEFDPKEAPFVSKMYEYATLIQQELCTTEKACKEINKLGYIARKYNKWNRDKTRVIGKTQQSELTPKKFWEYIRKPINTGFYCEKWTRHQLVPSKSPRLIPIEDWNNANFGKYKIIEDENSSTGWRLLDLNLCEKRSYRTMRADFPYKNLICCPKCKKPLKAAFSRGRFGKQYPFYFCNRGHKQVSINPKKLDVLLRGVFKDLCFSKEAANVLEAFLKQRLFAELQSINQWIIGKDEKIMKLRKKADETYERIGFLSNGMLIKKCEEDYESTIEEIAILESTRIENRHSEDELTEMISKVKETVEHLDELMLDTRNQETLNGLWKCIFTKNPTLEELERRTLSLSPIVSLKDLSKSDEKVWYRQKDSNRTLFNEVLRWNKILKLVQP